jgi:predicted phosphoadenosine phosphosulfate sulfurtransferase
MKGGFLIRSVPKERKYIDSDVYTEAKKRIKHVIEVFDTYWVAFSGGKDSLTVLHLVEEVQKEMRINKPVNVFFRDEELIPDPVIDFVNSIGKQKDRFNLKYFCIPLKSKKFLLGNTTEYIQWDSGREHIREMPDHAIKTNAIMDQFTSDTYLYNTLGCKGRTAFFTGIRADESLIRLESILTKYHESHICASADKRVNLVKPIYDWKVQDIFKYFYDNKIKYCSIYDMQLWNGEGLRVATPFAAESAKHLHKVKTRYPVFYNQLMQLFPEMELQARYWTQYSANESIEGYPHTFEGLYQWIDDNLEEEDMKKLALENVKDCLKYRNSAIKQGIGGPMGGYPLYHIWKQVINGQFKRKINPMGFPTKKMYEFEGLKYVSKK